MVELTDNVEKFQKRFGELSDKSRYLLAKQVLEDSNKHARRDSGDMILSSYRSSDLVHGQLVWNTPYAKRVYFTGTPSHDENPDAELMWVHVARDRYSKDWLVVFQNLAKKEILG